MKILKLFLLVLALMACASAIAGIKVDNVVPDPAGSYPGHSFLYRVSYASDANDHVCMNNTGCGNNYRSYAALCWVADPSATTCEPNWYNVTGIVNAIGCDSAYAFFINCMSGIAVVSGRGYTAGAVPPSSGYWCAGTFQTVPGRPLNIYPNSCSKVGGEPVSCSISAPNPLAHGDLALSDVNGKFVNSKAVLLCTGTATVKVRAIASMSNPTSVVPLRADGSITSRMTINGGDGATGVSIAVTANTPVNLYVTSTLATTQPTAGPLQGNAVLVLDVP